MAVLSDYVSGTITLTNGSNAFTGTGTGWLAASFREGDTILGIESNAGVEYVIASITGNGAGTLTQNWEGATGTYTYRMRYLPDGARVPAQAAQLVELLGNGNLQALAGLTGPGVPVFNGPHSMTIKPETDFINGVAYDVQVDTLPDRAAYDGQSAGFSVLVSDIGDGRSAIYSKNTNASGDWSDPAFVTGPVGPTPAVTTGPTTTLPPGQPASVTPVAVSGGVRLDFSIPRGQTGDISGVTPFWNTRLGADVDAASARTGLGAVGYEAQTLTAAQQGQALGNIGADVLVGSRNAIINGNGGVITRITRSTMAPVEADNGDYCHDQHKLLCSGPAAEYSSIYAPEPGVESMMRLRQIQATAQRFGYIQPIEAIRTYRMRGKLVTLGGKIRCSSSQPIRFAVLEWTGTGDVLNSNVVNNWESTSYTPGGFFLPTQLVVRAIGSITPVANTITDWSLLANISATANNVMVFYWTEGTAVQNVTLDQRWYLVEGDATKELEPFPPMDEAIEQKRCERYWWRGLPLSALNFNGYTTGAITSFPVPFPTTMRVVPAVMGSFPGIVISGADAPGVSAPTKNGCRMITSVTAATPNAYFAFGPDDYVQATAQL